MKITKIKINSGDSAPTEVRGRCSRLSSSHDFCLLSRTNTDPRHRLSHIHFLSTYLKLGTLTLNSGENVAYGAALDVANLIGESRFLHCT